MTNSTVGFATYYTVASCQREGTSGILTASGEPYNESLMTCALWITGKHGRPLRPTGKLVKVRCVNTGKVIRVRWTDNGPGRVPRSRGVIVDLTPAAMRALAGDAGIKAGRVEAEVLK
jgi:rare lipoprotein A (peptidoglycan hydrolase)